MKLSKETITILKNYASISPNILFTEGSVLKTRSIQNTIFSSVTIPEVFPADFGIYDLSEFLGVLGLFSNPELEFNDKFVEITEGVTSIKYFSADKSVLTVPTKDISFPEADVTFNITSDILASINKTGSVLRVPDISFVGEDGKLQLVVLDKKNPTSNAFTIDIGETDLSFKINFKIEMLKFIPTDYTVDISSKKVARFTSKNNNLNYFVGIESDSVFG